MKSSQSDRPLNTAPPKSPSEPGQTPTPTAVPARPSLASARPSSSRPTLQRLPHDPPQLRKSKSKSKSKNEPTTDSDTTDDGGSSSRPGSEESGDESGLTSSDTQADDQRHAGASKKAASPDEAELARLRAAVTARMFTNQQRARLSQQGALQSPAASATRRPSPIKEEAPVFSPLTSAFSSPLITTQTSSTESTSSSSKTVRGSTTATPAAIPLRTPSYPFPYVPGTPRQWSTSFHQPFTVLSPTVSAVQSADSSTPGNPVRSGGSTPAATGMAFAPFGSGAQTVEDSRFPSPNLYDLVLQLSAEPGLDTWWQTVAKMMHDFYKAERASLTLPADNNDIENVPWGQKATFNLNGYDDSSEDQASSESTDSQTNRHINVPPRSPYDEPRSPAPFFTKSRPALQARHSYAGYSPSAQGDQEHAQRVPANARPSMPSRTASHAPSLTNTQKNETPPTVFDHRRPLINIRHTSMSEPEFSSVGGEGPVPPHLAVYPVLKGLDSEVDGLIDTRGVNKVLERGKMVTLTRDYSNEEADSSNSSKDSQSDRSVETSQPQQPGRMERQDSQLTVGKSPQPIGNFRNFFSGLDSSKRRGSNYEEYEQYPPSPWSQSPAPSPAMQADPESNPFFAEESVEDSFNPVNATQDYSKLEPVEAIGIDRAHTVIHLPLMHPTLSQAMNPLQSPSHHEPRVHGRKGTKDETTSSQTSLGDRRAPIAILSLLSPAVPYPQNLVESLKLLGPHLATSYSIAHQYTNASMQATGLRHRRGLSGNNGGFEALSVDPSNLDDLIRADLDDVSGSVSGSMTSPSDYSGRSKHSPAGSIVGTPGWDASAYGMNTSKSVSGTPAGYLGADMIDSYFDAKKRGNVVHRSSSNAGANLPTQATPAKPAPKRVSIGAEDDGARIAVRSKSSSKSIRGDKPRSPNRLAEAASPRRPALRSTSSQAPPMDPADRKHSLLHSYGADFSTSFQGLPATTASRASGLGHAHARAPSISDENMPPPSERLLRTIIDSLPVQIFTAAPGTGALTWVNSKFLVYRGHDSRQVLNDPWQAIHPEDKNAYMETWHKSLKTGAQLQQKVRLQRFDGNYRWFYVRAAPLKDRRQNIVHWIGTNMDFHEQHLAELNSARQQETAASEAKYRALANSSPQVVFTVNKTKGITFCNSHWINYSGQAVAQALGLGFMEHVHPEDIVKCRLPAFDEGNDQPTNVPTTMPAEPRRTQSVSRQSSSAGSPDTERGPTSPQHSSPTSQMPQAKLSQLATTGILKVSRDADGRPSYSTEVRLRSKDGEYRWHLVRVVLADSEAQFEGGEETWYGTCTDINDHKTLERDLKETMDEKSRFLSNMSHEIRTPLNGITGMVNFLIDSSLTAEQMEHVNIIRASTEGLRGLINDILDLSKAEAGMIQLSMDWLHIRSLIEEVNDLTSAMAIDKGLELNYLVESNVPSQIKGDRFRIRQILLNIIGNAIKFTLTGEVFVRCRILADEERVLSSDEMFIQFEIIDTGQGFTEKEAQYLFKRFSQIDGSSTRQHGGTGLGLVISRQLAQLHGGDMSATGVPTKGATFTFYIKTTLPSESDKPPAPPPTPGVAAVPVTPSSPGPQSTSTALKHEPRASNTIPLPAIAKVKSPAQVFSPQDLSPDAGGSPLTSSGGSDPSIYTNRSNSVRSERSSASSYVPDPSLGSPSPMPLAMPGVPRPGRADNTTSTQSHPMTETTPAAIRMLSPGGTLQPRMFSILVVCPLKYSREATVQHIDMTLPKNIPHQITARESVVECQRMIGGDDPMIFSHVVLVLQDVAQIISFLDQVLSSPPHSSTQLILITDLAQRRKLIEQAPSKYDYEQLAKERRLRFIFKPLKPSRFAVIFDPQKEREMSTDRNQDSAQQVAVSQKQVFEELSRRLGNQGNKVLLVEDNRVNQMVLLKFLSKVNIQVETVLDGVQCTEKIYAKPHGYYSIILCDLHMPNKDGYQTCREIRKWEKKNSYPYLPIVALSANVLGDVYAKCADAGFNSYVTKPVDFKELSTVMLNFMDPADPGRPIEFMKSKK
ncbi:hypothetical protein MBLNU459_g2748t1 [Dothideomycetes sp. NU459]